MITSTGNGKILATDGGAEIAITNASSGDLTVGRIINNNIEGKISITDLARNTWTEYSRSATSSMSMNAYEKYLKLPDADKNAFASMTEAEKAAKEAEKAAKAQAKQNKKTDTETATETETNE